MTGLFILGSYRAFASMQFPLLPHCCCCSVQCEIGGIYLEWGGGLLLGGYVRREYRNETIPISLNIYQYYSLIYFQMLARTDCVVVSLNLKDRRTCCMKASNSKKLFVCSDNSQWLA